MTTHKPYGHTEIPKLIRFFKQLTDTIAFVHFSSWFDRKGAPQAKKLLRTLSNEYSITLIVGYDGMPIDTEKLKR